MLQCYGRELRIVIMNYPEYMTQVQLQPQAILVHLVEKVILHLIEGAWTPENTNAKYPRLTTIANGNNAARSTWWVVNGQYLRLKNFNIGYNVPERVLRKTPFSRINIYLAGTNLLTLSHFKYVDPESPSVSNGYYPQQKTYSLGLNVTF